MIIYIYDENRQVWVLYNNKIVDSDFWDNFDKNDFEESES